MEMKKKIEIEKKYGRRKARKKGLEKKGKGDTDDENGKIEIGKKHRRRGKGGKG